MINEKEIIETQKKEKDASSEGSNQSLNGFDENVSDVEYGAEPSIAEDKMESVNFEEEIPQKIQMRCG